MDENKAKRIAEKTYQQYKDKPDAMVERKIGVIRSLVVNRENVDYNEARMAGLDRVVHGRQQRKRSREKRDEVRSWSAEAREWVAEARKWIGVFAAIGVVGLGALIAAFWKSLVKWFGG